MEILQHLLDQSQYAVLTAFILGLMTAISPCPLATNIAAIGFISRNIENRKRIFFNGLIYTLGAAFSYTVLALILYLGASTLSISVFFQGWGEKFFGPLLIVIGLFMLGVFNLKFPAFSKLTERIGERSKGSYKGAFLLGMVFALAFCPYSGVLYFAMLIPMTISSLSGLLLPVVYALAAGIPVVVLSWLLAFAVGNLAAFYNRINLFERWFRRVVAVVFMLVGSYYIYLQF